MARTGKPDYRHRLVLAYADSAHASQVSRHFRRQGWEVHQVGSGALARRLARELAPQVVVLDTELPDESGWLTCAKLLCDRPGQKVVLVGVDRAAACQRLSDFVGAARLVHREDGVTALLDGILASALPNSA